MTCAPRALTLQDLPGLMVVQRTCYGDGYLESAEVYTHRLASPHQHSLVLERAGQICAYLAAYDSQQGCLTPLHGHFYPAAHADTLYLHDMAVLPQWAGQGLAQRLLDACWRAAVARGLKHSSLVAVQGSQGFWQRYGYQKCFLSDAVQRQRLAGYGGDAVYMVRALGQH